MIDKVRGLPVLREGDKSVAMKWKTREPYDSMVG